MKISRAFCSAIFFLSVLSGYLAADEIHEAVKKNDIQAVQELVNMHPDFVNLKDESGKTPLHIAAEAVTFGLKNLVNLMLEHDADIPVEGEEVEVLLHLSAARGLEQLARRMFILETDIHSKNENGGTLLHSAAEGEMFEFLSLLLEKGLNVDETNRYGMTPLHVAAWNGNKNSVEILCKYKAKMNSRDLSGHTPLNLAEKNHHAEVAEFLKSRGADDSPPRFPELSGEYLGQKKPGMEPLIFAPGIVSSIAYEHSAPVFSPDGKEVYWTVLSGQGYIYSMKLVDGKWTMPRMAPFSGDHADFYPFFSSEGKKLFYTSYRPLEEGKKNPGYGITIWFVEREGEGWSPPKPVGPPINTGYEFGFSLAKNGTLYFTRGGSGSFDIYRSGLVDGKYNEAEKLPEPINSEHDEDRPFIAPDESYLIFESERPVKSGTGGGLFVCFRKPDGSWTQPVNMDEKIDSVSRSSFPYVSPDGKFFFFVSKKNGNNDIYWVDAKIIDELRLKDKK